MGFFVGEEERDGVRGQVITDLKESISISIRTVSSRWLEATKILLKRNNTIRVIC